MDKNQIELKRFAESFFNEAKRNAKPDCCFLCGRAMESFCNSHTVPQFVLKNITVDGKAYNGFHFSNRNFMPNDNGLTKILTFRMICNECDRKYFNDYENEATLLNVPSNHLLAEIALKNALFDLCKRLRDRETYKLFDSRLYEPLGKEIRDEANELTISDTLFCFRRSKKIIDKNLKSGFEITYYKVLDKKVPIAIQTDITLYKCFGKMINDIYDLSPKWRVQPLNLCVFPLAEKTVVLLFHHRDDRNMKVFDKAFLKLSDNNKLKYINYIIFRYTENFAISPIVPEKILDNDKLHELFTISMINYSLEENEDLYIDKIPNFFDLDL